MIERNIKAHGSCERFSGAAFWVFAMRNDDILILYLRSRHLSLVRRTSFYAITYLRRLIMGFGTLFLICLHTTDITCYLVLVKQKNE